MATAAPKKIGAAVLCEGDRVVEGRHPLPQFNVSHFASGACPCDDNGAVTHTGFLSRRAVRHSGGVLEIIR